MSTRKELMENLRYEMENLSERIEDNTSAFDTSDLEYSIDGLAGAVETAGKNLFLGMIVSSVFYYLGKQTQMVTELAVKQMVNNLQQLNRQADMVKSVQSLQERYSRLSYDLIIARSFVENSDTEMRRAILNGLVVDEILVEYEEGGQFFLMPDPQGIDDFWDHYDCVFDRLKRLSKWKTLGRNEKQRLLEECTNGEYRLEDFE